MSLSPSRWLLNLPYQTSPAFVFGSFSVVFSTTGFWDPAVSFQFWSFCCPVSGLGSDCTLCSLCLSGMPLQAQVLVLCYRWSARCLEESCRWHDLFGQLSRDGVDGVCAPDREVFSLVDFHKSWLPLVWMFLELAVIWSPTWEWDISTQRHGSKSGYASGKNSSISGKHPTLILGAEFLSLHWGWKGSLLTWLCALLPLKQGIKFLVTSQDRDGDIKGLACQVLVALLMWKKMLLSDERLFTHQRLIILSTAIKV